MLKINIINVLCGALPMKKNKEREALLKDLKAPTDDDFCGIESGQGEFSTSYANIRNLLGDPNSEGDGEKIDVEWVFRYKDAAPISIHNWKDGPMYCGAEGTPVRRITSWSVSGRSRDKDLIVEFIDRFLKAYPEMNLPKISKTQRDRIHKKIDNLTDTKFEMLVDFLYSL